MCITIRGEKMIIEIDTKSEIPIYTQLVFQIKKGIYKGKLKPGDSLPSVRSLAGDIGINLHTVNKAYKKLVTEGAVIQVKKGYEISRNAPPKISREYNIELEMQVENLLIDAGVYGLDLKEVMERVGNKLEGVDRDD